MSYIQSRSPLDQAKFLFRSRNFQALAQLADEILAADAAGFLATYYRGLAAMGEGDEILARNLIRKAQSVRPEIKNYDFLDPLYRRQGKSDAEILHQHLMTMELFSNVDTFLLSYPKCGRTWLRFMLGVYALKGGPGDPLNIEQISAANPDLATLEISHDDYPHWKPAGEIVTEKKVYKDKRVIFLARDPRDAIVSYFFQYTLRGDKDLAKDSSFDGDLSEFVRHDIGGLPSLVSYYNTWAANRDVPAAFLLITYEDIQKDVRGSLKQVVEFLGWPDYGADVLDRAVAAGDFESMHQLEASNALDNVRLQPPKDGNPEGFKVRRGVVGGFRDYLSERDIEWIDNYLRDELDDLFVQYKYAS